MFGNTRQKTPMAPAAPAKAMKKGKCKIGVCKTPKKCINGCMAK